MSEAPSPTAEPATGSNELPPTNWDDLPPGYFTPKSGLFGRRPPEKICSFVSQPVHHEVKKVFISCNPFGGNGRGKKVLKEAQSLFTKAGVDMTVEITTPERLNTEIARTIDLDQYDAFVVIGGDGTLHEAINGMMNREDGKKIPLGVIPAGTGNSFAADLCVENTAAAVAAIVAGDACRMDLGLCTIGDERSYFFNIVNWPAEMMVMAEQLRWLGALRYKLAVGHQVLGGYYGDPVVLTVDGVRKEYAHLNMLQIQNNQHTGEQAPAAPQARCDDGYLDGVALHSMGRMAMAGCMQQLENGGWLYHHSIDRFRFKKLTLESLRDHRVINVDGELQHNKDPFTVEVQAAAIQVFLPPKAHGKA